MTWLTDEKAVSAARERTENAMRIPLGMASPLWLAFGAAASVGVTWWWMTRWTKAVNLEAMTPFKPTWPVLTVVEPAPQPDVVAEPSPDPVSPIAASVVVAEALSSPEPKTVTPAIAALEATPVEVIKSVSAPAVAAPAPKAAPVKRAATAPKPVPAAPAVPDDLTRLVGIGPKLADALAARQVTQFSQIAAWTDADLAKFDAELRLMGRAVRDSWVAQAKRFARARN